MFSLVSGLYQWLFSYDELRLLLVGLDGSGKTTFLEQLKARHSKRRGSALRPSSSPSLHAHQAAPADATLSAPEAAPAHRHDVDVTANSPSSPSSPSFSSFSSSSSSSSSSSCSPQSASPSCSSSFTPPLRSPAPLLPQVRPTTGFNLTRFVYERFQVTIWDLGGRETLRDIWKDYYADCDCVLFFVDAAALSREEEAAQVFQCMLDDLAASASQAGPRGEIDDPACSAHRTSDAAPPVLFVANKQDLSNAESGERLLSRFLFRGDRPADWPRTDAQEKRRTTVGAVRADDGPVQAFSHTAVKSESVDALLCAAVAAARATREVHREEATWTERPSKGQRPSAPVLHSQGRHTQRQSISSTQEEEQREEGEGGDREEESEGKGEREGKGEDRDEEREERAGDDREEGAGDDREEGSGDLVVTEDSSDKEGSGDSNGLYDIEEAQRNFEFFLASRLYACSPSSSRLSLQHGHGSPLGRRLLKHKL
ncbi:ADP-ribosylation factor family protein [Toxoplasma gondii GAB2-2007-GAL-DOM2]|uniref:ADP-ribosylation factor n=5 Tax=Toxoplasma gondii TaxID=5811 RepID=S7W0E8_TOXGG|nr:hypothetical protein TGGT1_240950 [Toxoplasma gondii GT1]KAF4643356.1 hypothetical protein TGRH88_030220 [Toxoplasma gondii]KFG39246.1 ADP-ribosylation factor family protein [Toxoplasma gondii GAB2-2007-GAL-DOM2]KFG48905.1 ADP-ribosylation factor family protein [Toxoplasma gondii FOU]RQX66735.1 ADP-ribosylation factor family protein [Toxoplasma gondii CAST]